KYERAFRSLLFRVRSRRLQSAVDRLLTHAQSLHHAQGVPLVAALAQTYDVARERVIFRLQKRSHRRHASLFEMCIARAPIETGPDFHCDSGLLGLARWLRGAGYDAAFWSGIDDDELLRKMPGSSAILLTTDEPLMRRGAIRRGAI